jgi:hypothetical protein
MERDFINMKGDIARMKGNIVRIANRLDEHDLEIKVSKKAVVNWLVTVPASYPCATCCS